MKIKIFPLVLILLLASVTGCAGKSGFIVSKTKLDSRDAETKLSTAAESISQSLQELAQISRTTQPRTQMRSPLEPDMIGMGQLGSIDWSGPVEPLVKKIAQVTGYKLHVLGTQPAIPILISITAKDTPLADILRDAEFQCGGKAHIVIYPASKIIELRYTRSQPI